MDTDRQWPSKRAEVVSLVRAQIGPEDCPDADDGPCSDCGRVGWRWQYGRALALCFRCAGSRQRASRVAAA